jgi:DNA replication protein DnaC
LKTEDINTIMGRFEQMVPSADKLAEMEARDKIVRDAQERDAAMRVSDAKDSAGICERYKEASLQNYRSTTPEQEKELQFFKAYLAGILRRQDKSVALVGPVGTGKTWIGSALVADVIEGGSTAAIIPAKRYTGLIRESYRKDSPMSELDILEKYSRVQLLVLDEIGRQFESDAEKLYLFELIDERYRAKKPTVFLSNLSNEEIRAFLGDAIVDRIKEGGGAIRVLNWESRRGAK